MTSLKKHLVDSHSSERSHFYRSGTPGLTNEDNRYDEIRNLYVEQLAFDWMEDSTTEMIRARVETKIDNFAKGDLEHATEILLTLLEIANNDGDVEAPANTSFTVSGFPALTPRGTC